MKKSTLIMTMMIPVLFAGCEVKIPDKEDSGQEEQGGQQPAETVLNLSVTSLTLDNNGNAKTFSIVANGEWTLTNGSTWCKTDKTGGKGNAVVSVTAFPHEEYDDRSTNLTVKSGKKTQVLAVTQKKKDALLLTEEKYTLGQEGGTITVEVKSNLTYSVTIPSAHRDWIKETSTPATKALTTAYKHFAIAPNPDNAAREGIIVFKDNGGSLADTVRIFQARREELILLQDRHFLSAAAQTLSVDLQTNVDYEVIIPAASDWITLSASPAVERADLLRLDIAANPTRNQRSGEVVVADRNGTLADTLHIVQEGKAWTVCREDVTLTSVEEIKEFIAQGYDEVYSLTIEINDPDFTDLSAFSNHQTKKISYLYIRCPHLQSFQGMAGLEEVGSLYLTGNYPSLVSFSGLETLKSLKSLCIGVYQADNINTFRYLTTFQGLNGIKTLETLRLHGNFPSLRSFEGLENLTTVTSYDLEGTFDALTSFKGLKNVKTISSFQLKGKFPVLASFEGLENLTAINSFLLDDGYLNGQWSDGTFDELTDFRGLENLERIGSFEFAHNIKAKSLKNFSGLGKVEYIGDFSINRNASLPALQSFEGFDSLKEIERDLDLVFSYSSPCSSLNGLNHLTTVGGNVKITGNYSGELTSLQGLNSLKTVGGTVTIEDCYQLLSIDGLSGLQTFPNALNGAKVLKINNCRQLKNFCALSDDFLRYYDLEVTGCGYNPTRADLLNGNCSQ